MDRFVLFHLWRIIDIMGISSEGRGHIALLHILLEGNFSYRFGVDVDSTATTGFTGGRERFDQTLSDPLSGHLDQAQRGYFGTLMFGPIAA